MMNDPQIPERDTAYRGNPLNDQALEQKAAQQRRMVSKWDRDELEDKYLRLHEENIILKKHARRQEEKIKKMATKLLRLASDRKKSAIDGEGQKVKAADSTTVLEERVQELEKRNSQLKEQLILARQQVATTSKRSTLYFNVPARIDTGIPKIPSDPRLSRNLRVVGPSPDMKRRRGTNSPPRFAPSQLEETQADRKQLVDFVAQLQETVGVYEIEIDNLKEQMRIRESEYEEDLVKVKQQMTAEQRANVQENIDLIKVQRDVKAKANQLIEMQQKYSALEESMRTVKHSHDQMLMEMEHLNMQLKDEQNRVLILQTELKLQASSQKKNFELQEQVSSLQRENEILKEANEKLVSSAFDLEREREWRKRENALKVQIAQLEATLKSDLGEKGGIIDRYAREKEAHEKLQVEFRELQITYFQLKEQYDDLQEKMKFFTKETAVDFTEMEEALVLVKQKKQQTMKQPDFLISVDEELKQDHKKQLIELQAEYAETVHELEKTRNMLVVQHKINKDYQTEVDAYNDRINEIKSEYELKLDEYARLLDIRAARIKKLEAQLRDVAYGTRQYKTMPPTDEIETAMEFDETINLERGQNLFEIHVHKANLSPDGLKMIGDEDPLLFCTWEFYEFEIQSTPVVRGPKPEFDFTSQYIVKVDDFFLHYLQKESCTLELHQSFGQDFRTVAACQLVFKELFDKTFGRIHGVAYLTGLEPNSVGVGFGTIEYWVRLRVPMEQALRLYKERTKALGYITANEKADNEALQALDETAAKRPANNINELHIKILRCYKVHARRENIQPSPYCIYQFFDFGDHDTAIIPNTNNPEFMDHQTYAVSMTADLDQYLKTVHLKVFIFDDTDPEEAHYLGVANIPLIPLAHNKLVTGIFELKTRDGKKNGVIEIELRWQYTYVPPKKRTHEPLPMDQEITPIEPPQRLEPEPKPSPAPLPPPHPKSQKRSKFPAPSATSTPMPADKLAAIEDQIIPDAELGKLSQAEPKPAARKRLMTEEEPAESAQSVLQDAVSDVVSEFLPGVSSSLTLGGTAHHALGETLLSDVSDEEKEKKSKESVRSTPKTTPTTMPNGMSKPASALSLKDSKEDTFFEEEVEEEIREEVENGDGTLTPSMPIRDEKLSEESESEPTRIESDSEGLVMMHSKPTRRSKKTLKAGDQILIVISHLSLEENSAVMKNAKVKQLYVEYKFLGVDPQDSETPYSLPKPKPHHQITFHFSKVIQVDMERHLDRRRYLASMLLPGHPENGRIRFTVVSEPPDDQQDDDCEDVGVAFANIKDILVNRKDIQDQDIDILDIQDEKTKIGSLNVTVECLAALKAVEKELQVDGTF